jgi:hypothetical protein
MLHYDERTIDLFVQNPTLLAPEVLQAMERHFPNCPACRGLATFLQEYYRELNEYADSRSSEVEAIMARLMPMPSIIRLRPYRPTVSRTPMGNTYISVMAAMSASPQPTSGTVATLASERDHIVLRIRAEKEGTSYHLFLHADDPRKLEGVLVDFPEVPAGFVLDEKGQAEFQWLEGRRPKEWSSLEAIAHFPIAAQTVNGDMLRKEGSCTADLLLAKGRCAVELTYDASTSMLSARCSRPGGEVSALTLKAPSGTAYLIPLQNGEGRIAIPGPPPELVLRLYAGPAAG